MWLPTWLVYVIAFWLAWSVCDAVLSERRKDKQQLAVYEAQQQRLDAPPRSYMNDDFEQSLERIRAEGALLRSQQTRSAAGDSRGLARDGSD